MNIFKWKTAAVSGVVLMFFSGLVFANTPDGETPAEEVFCEQFDGKAKGLCNAYCEAMDCHDPANAKASLNACNNVGDKLVAATPDFEGDVKACGINVCPCEEFWLNAEGVHPFPPFGTIATTDCEDFRGDPSFPGIVAADSLVFPIIARYRMENFVDNDLKRCQGSNPIGEILIPGQFSSEEFNACAAVLNNNPAGGCVPQLDENVIIP